MTRRILNFVCCVAAVILATCGIVIYLFPRHYGRVWDGGVSQVNIYPGSIGWFYEDNRAVWANPPAWSRTTRSLGLVGVSWDTHGHRYAWIPGARVEWKREPSGYRGYWVTLRPFILACLCLVPPIAVIAFTRTRRLIRLRRGRCVGCAYDLRENLSGRCPECGREHRDAQET